MSTDIISEDKGFFDVYLAFICDLILSLLELCGRLECVYILPGVVYISFFKKI